jgi:hypothetical protein
MMSVHVPEWHTQEIIRRHGRPQQLDL